MDEDTKNPRVMPDDKYQKARTLTQKEVVDFLNGVNEEARCTFCGGDFGVPPSVDGQHAATVKLPVSGKDTYVLMYMAVCIQCGNTNLHTAGTVVDWLNSHKDGE